MTGILNVVIGVVFVFLLFSLIVSALNELWLSWKDMRSSFLKKGLRELLQDREKDLPLVQKILDHGLVDALSRGNGTIPAYIDPAAFTAAVLDLIAPATTTKTRVLDDFRQAISKLSSPGLRESITAILDASGDNLDNFKAGLADWYSRTMVRVSGWYKNYAQKWLFALGLLLAIGCNVDTIHIIQVLSADPQLAAATAEEAVAYLKAHPSRPAAAAPTPAPGETTPPPQTAAGAAPSLATLQNNVQTSLSDLGNLSVPIGWNAAARVYLWAGAPHWAHLLSALLGWLVTALAASLGAPFWFDTLQRFVNIRGNGRSPAEAALKAQKDNASATA